MVSLGTSLHRTLEHLYTVGDPGFREILSQVAEPHNDEALAELIELDGRLRLARGLPVDLRRYLDSLPDLDRRPIALDTAIDVTLRSLSGTSHLEPEAVETLADQYPTLAGPIREAAVLSQAIWSTTGLQQRFIPKSRRTVPCDFGPRLASGQGRYELRRLLGAGAGGEVYLAVDRQLSEDDHPAFVAIKLLNTNNSDPWARRRLIDEATKARRISHPNVARVLDRGVTDQNEDFIVYEFVPGGDLAAWYQARAATLDLRSTVALVARIARGVQAAHSAGLVHCDLKPGNVLVSADEEPKVTDFGIAVRAGQNPVESGDYPSDRPVGNLAFVSPEQYRMEEGCLSIPSDIYALGGVLFYLITGVLPNGKTLDEVRRNHDRANGRRQPPTPSEHQNRIDRTLDMIIRRAMALRPEDRYSSAGALADDLDAWRARESIAWTKPSAAHRVRLWATRRPGLAATLVIAAVTAIVGGAVAQHWWSQAEIERAKNQAVREKAEQFNGLLTVLQKDRIEQELLPTIMAFEWVGGETVLGTSLDRSMLWKNRIAAVRVLVADDVASGRDDQLESLFWRTALSLWLINDGKYQEAEKHLDIAQSKWRDRLAPDDRWMGQIRLLRDAASVKRILAESRAASGEQAAGKPTTPANLTEEQRRTLGELETRLIAGQELFKGRFSGSPAHRTTLTALIEINGPVLLDRVDQRKKYERARRQLDK